MTTVDSFSNGFVFQEAENLIREIAVLELEVAYLERYVLSLCRRRFAHHDSDDQDSASGIERGENITRHGSCPSLPRHPTGSPPEECNLIQSTLRQSEMETHRSQSSLSHRSLSCSNRIIPPVKSPAECDSTFHSLPLSMLEVNRGLFMRKTFTCHYLKLPALTCSILFSKLSVRDQT